jgi:Uma2 family endonuclease
MARMTAIPLYQPPIEYPTSDGKPMGETTLHRKVMVDLIHGLTTRFQNDPEVWIGGNLFLCYRQGDTAAVLCPDVLLVHGIGKRDRRNFLLWEERPPSLIVEVTSPSTRREDQSKKKGIYEKIGVEEYVLFDPYGESLRPPLQGFRLERSRYEPIPLEPDGTLASRTAGLSLRREPNRDGEGERLRLVDPATGEGLRWPEESEALAQRAAVLEAELARLRSERG